MLLTLRADAGQAHIDDKDQGDQGGSPWTISNNLLKKWFVGKDLPKLL